MSLEVDLRSRAGDFTLDVAFHTEAGITALFGPSGAGKTLTLRHIAGLATADEGRIVFGTHVLFDASTFSDIPPRHRRVGYLFQDYALFPHIDVGGNLAYGLPNHSREERRDRVRTLLALVGLDGFERRRIQGLSGGERQRVALARALAPEPELLLLDEPFAALDFRIRASLRDELRDVHERTGVPMVLVTHSLPDIRALSRRLVLIDRGRVVAEGATEELMASPPPGVGTELLRGEPLY